MRYYETPFGIFNTSRSAGRGLPPSLVYGLVDPTGHVRYIGRSSMGLARAAEHVSRHTRERTHKAAWIRSLLQVGEMYSVRVLEVCTDEASAVQQEVQWIAFARAQDWPLVNMTDGGEGTAKQQVALPDDELVSRYLAGESELALSHAYGVNRWTITRRLLKRGVERRDQAGSMRARASRMTAEERKALARPAQLERKRRAAERRNPSTTYG